MTDDRFLDSDPDRVLLFQEYEAAQRARSEAMIRAARLKRILLRDGLQARDLILDRLTEIEGKVLLEMFGDAAGQP
jgi:2-polyprenyl-6-methoxyphenol hydroxylase-like FAD-dependent oxidoreductase